jgi:hypothetical protein
MNKEAIEQLIFDLDQKISEMVRQRDHLRALVTLADQLDAATAERLASGILNEVKVRAAEIDAVSNTALSTRSGSETQ